MEILSGLQRSHSRVELHPNVAAAAAAGDDDDDPIYLNDLSSVEGSIHDDWNHRSHRDFLHDNLDYRSDPNGGVYRPYVCEKVLKRSYRVF